MNKQGCGLARKGHGNGVFVNFTYYAYNFVLNN